MTTNSSDTDSVGRTYESLKYEALNNALCNKSSTGTIIKYGSVIFLNSTWKDK